LKQIPFFLLLSFFWLSSLPGVTQESEKPQRVFSESALKEYQQDPKFDYSVNVQPPDSFLSKVAAWVLGTLAKWFSTPNGTWIGDNLFRIILLGLVVIGVLLIVRLNFGKAMVVSSARSESKKAAIPVVEDNLNYQRLFEEAKRDQDGQLAIRYLYLLTLVSLQQKGMLKLTRWKTSLDYAYELPSNQKLDFKEITRVFSRSWYGNVAPSMELLHACEKASKRLTNG